MGAPSGLRLRGKEPEGGYRSSSVAKSRRYFATGRDQLPWIDGQPDAARFISRCVLYMAVPLIESISVTALVDAARGREIERREE